MPKSTLRFVIIFSVLLLIELVVPVQLAHLPELHWVTKSLLVLSLMVFVALSKVSFRQFPTLYFALFFSMLGDVFLLFQENSEIFFMSGLGSFLAAHLCYAHLFFKSMGPKEHEMPRRMLFFLVGILLYGAGLILVLWPGLNELKLPVIAYAGVLMLMSIGAWNRDPKVNPGSFSLVLAGALFFIASDSLLAVNKFVWELPAAHVLIMSTYGIAQLLIVLGVINAARPSQA